MYLVARLMGDWRAARLGKVKRRIFRRAVGKILGRILRAVFR